MPFKCVRSLSTIGLHVIVDCESRDMSATSLAMRRRRLDDMVTVGGGRRRVGGQEGRV